VALLVFGSHRIEPLDFWWGPHRSPMLIAYAVIIIGGLVIGHRLRLLAMGLAFWVTLAAGMAVLAVFDHSITARWSLGPIQGPHFWWVVLTSPEILIFLFFMLTDPRTVPSGRVARIVFGITVATLGSLLMAPWQTEFGVKVGLLASLAIVCAARPLLERSLPIAGAPDDDPRRWFAAVLRSRVRRSSAAAAAAGLLIAVAAAGVPARAADQPPPPPDRISPIDPASLPIVTIDPQVAGLSARMATQAGAQELAETLAFNLEVEHEALRTRDSSLLTSVDHGDRLSELTTAIDGAGSDGTIVARTYQFHTLHLIVVFPGGAQRGPNAGLIAAATESDVVYAADGHALSHEEHEVDITFAMRRTTSEHWQITTTLPPPS
jgi:hypothetical protein